jgi:hypothetical protein
MNEFGAWDDFVAVVNRKGYAWRNLLGQDRHVGQWTPALAFSGGNTGITYNSSFGEFIEIGRLIFVAFIITTSSKGSSTGTARITGLPVAPATSTDGFFSLRWGNLATSYVNMWTNPNILGYLDIYGITAAATSSASAVLDTALNNVTTFQGHAIYRTGS